MHSENSGWIEFSGMKLQDELNRESEFMWSLTAFQIPGFSILQIPADMNSPNTCNQTDPYTNEGPLLYFVIRRAERLDFYIYKWICWWTTLNLYVIKPEEFDHKVCYMIPMKWSWMIFIFILTLVNTQFMHPHTKRKLRHESSKCNTLCNF